jgi:hypothetical protein
LGRLLSALLILLEKLAGLDLELVIPSGLPAMRQAKSFDQGTTTAAIRMVHDGVERLSRARSRGIAPFRGRPV